MIGPFIKGLILTFRHMFKKPVTVNYPYQKVPVFPKYRGKQVLMRDENGLEKCVACGLCAVAWTSIVPSPVRCCWSASSWRSRRRRVATGRGGAF